MRYIGDPVAAVAAIDEDTAEEALDLIEVEYEPLPAVFDPLEAIKEDAPQVHEGVELNINVTRHIEWGDVDEAFKKCDHIREDQFKCSSQAHMCMETHCAVASFDHGGKLTVWTSTQASYYMQVLLADMLGLREGDVRVIKPPTGGGFGSKFELDSAQFCASVLSMKICQPVKIVFTREEEFTATKRRTPMYYYIKLGAKKDGTLLAKEVRVITEGGAYTGMGATALYLTGFFSSFPYKYPNYRYDGYRAYTNTAPTSAMRGFGAPQAVFVGESQLDMMADDLGIDPIEIRRKNGMTPNYEVPGQAIHPELRAAPVPGQDRGTHQGTRQAASQPGHRHCRLRLHVRRHLQLVRHAVCLLRRRGQDQHRRQGGPVHRRLRYRPGLGYHAEHDLRRGAGRAP